MRVIELIDNELFRIDAVIAEVRQKQKDLREERCMILAAIDIATPADEPAFSSPPSSMPSTQDGASKTRKPRTENGPRRTGLRNEVLEYIINGDGMTPGDGIALVLKAKPQSVSVSLESLLKAGKIVASGNGGYHPVETHADAPAGMRRNEIAA